MSIDIHPTIAGWQATEHVVGMLVFRAFGALEDEWFYEPAAHLVPLALDEADLLCLDNQSGELLVLDHEVQGRVLCDAARSQGAFLQSIELLQAYINRCIEDDTFSDDESQGVAARQACAQQAGGVWYESFFSGLIGW